MELVQIPDEPLVTLSALARVPPVHPLLKEDLVLMYSAFGEPGQAFLSELSLDSALFLEQYVKVLSCVSAENHELGTNPGSADVLRSIPMNG